MMLTYADYIASKPLPVFSAPMFIEYVTEPPVGIGRVVRPGECEAKIQPKYASDDEFIACLSAEKWMSIQDICAALQVSDDAARNRMSRTRIESMTIRRFANNRHEWRLAE